MLSEVNGSLDRVSLGPQHRLLVPDCAPVNLLSLWPGQDRRVDMRPLRSLQKSRLSQVLTMKVSQRDHTRAGAASDSPFPLERPVALAGSRICAHPRMQAPQPDSEHVPWAECVPVHAAAPAPPPRGSTPRGQPHNTPDSLAPDPGLLSASHLPACLSPLSPKVTNLTNLFLPRPRVPSGFPLGAVQRTTTKQLSRVRRAAKDAVRETGTGRRRALQLCYRCTALQIGDLLLPFGTSGFSEPPACSHG